MQPTTDVAEQALGTALTALLAGILSIVVASSAQLVDFRRAQTKIPASAAPLDGISNK